MASPLVLLLPELTEALYSLDSSLWYCPSKGPGPSWALPKHYPYCFSSIVEKIKRILYLLFQGMATIRSVVLSTVYFSIGFCLQTICQIMSISYHSCKNKTGEFIWTEEFALLLLWQITANFLESPAKSSERKIIGFGYLWSRKAPQCKK